MELTCKCVDYGDAPTILSTGICRIFFISRHIVRVTYFRNDVDDNGLAVKRVSGHVDWDITDLREAHETINKSLEEILASPPPYQKRRVFVEH